MRGNFTASLLLLGLFISTIGGGLAFYAPVAVHKKLEIALKASGFKNAQIIEKESGWGHAEYHIKLDNEDFSSIESLKINYSTIGTILFSSFDSVQIENIRLTGEINENQKLSIAGWTNSPLQNITHSLFNANAINIKNAQVSLLSNNHGGISLQISAQGHKTNTGMSFQGKVSNTQKHMRYRAKMSGHINSPESWQSDFVIEEAKLNMPHLKAARVTGEVNITKDLSTPNAYINGQLRSGNLGILKTSWKDASLTIEGNLKAPQTIIAAKSNTYKNLELGLSLPNLQNLQTLSGYIYTQEPQSIFDLLEQHKPLELKKETTERLLPLTNTEIAFEKNGKFLDINIRNQQNDIDITGRLQAGAKNQYKFESFINALAKKLNEEN